MELLSESDESSPVSYKTTIYAFPHGEIWQLRFSPHENDVMSCIWSEYQSSQVTMKTALLKLPNPETIAANANGQEYLQFTDLEILETNGSEIKTTEFNPTDSNVIAIVLDDKIRVLSRAEASYTTICEVQTGKNGPKFNGGKWSQQNVNQFICLHENAVKSYDTRMTLNHVAWIIEEAHGQQLVRDIDCNPNKQCHVVTGGDDGAVKIWDCRSPKQPVFVRSDHNHWIFSVRFNTFHDSLVLSSSSDNKVILTCARSVSSEADEEGTERNTDNLADGLLQTFEQHEDSIYCCEWSTADPFTFASLSFDGRIIISQVPKQYKYQFLM